MSIRTELLTPIGRLVQGSLYEPQTTDALNNPLVNKNGEPRVKYYFGLAIKKSTESHWSQTEWGMKIYSAAQVGFPQGQFNSPTFAWKIIDGDSTIPNKAGRIPSASPGHAGHWILHFSTGMPSKIYNHDGSKQILESKFVNLGDYIQVFGSVSGNDSLQQPGVYLNHSLVAFCGYGERIILGPDPKSVGFGGALPAGASLTPLTSGFNPVTMPLVPTQVTAVPVLPIQSITPHYGILAPGAISITPPAQNPTPRIMTPSAPATYEQMIAAGWSDAQLIQHGMMIT